MTPAFLQMPPGTHRLLNPLNMRGSVLANLHGLKMGFPLVDGAMDTRPNRQPLNEELTNPWAFNNLMTSRRFQYSHFCGHSMQMIQPFFAAALTVRSNEIHICLKSRTRFASNLRVLPPLCLFTCLHDVPPVQGILAHNRVGRPFWETARTAFFNPFSRVTSSNSVRRTTSHPDVHG